MTTWVDGIGPPLEQLEQDYAADDHVTSRDVLALIREVRRLRGLEWLARDFVWSSPIEVEHPTYYRLVDWFSPAGPEAVKPQDQAEGQDADRA